MTKTTSRNARDNARTRTASTLSFPPARKPDDHDLLAFEVLLEDLLQLVIHRSSQAGADGPAAAPEMWVERDRKRRETPPAFIRRVYAPWLGHGLTRSHLLALDAKLSHELTIWLRKYPGDEIATLLALPAPPAHNRPPPRPS
jgi:hypothetical protein